jgi:hypothetical protein
MTTNTCPNPTAAQFAELIRATRRLIVEVETVNAPRAMSPREAASYAIDGMAEGWELNAESETKLRDYFHAMTNVADRIDGTIMADWSSSRADGMLPATIAAAETAMLAHLDDPKNWAGYFYEESRD